MIDNKFIELPKKTYTQYVIEDKVQEFKLPTIEEILQRKQAGQPALTEQEKDYIRRGYKQEIIAYPADDDLSIERNQHLISALNRGKLGRRAEFWNGEISAYDENNFQMHRVKTSSGASIGVGGAIASGSANYSAFRVGDSSNEARFGSVSVGGEVGVGLGGATAKAKLGVDLVSASAGGVKARLGANLDTGGSIGDGGVEVKIAGVGVKVGKEMGVSTPLGEVSVDLEEACVIQ